MSCRLGSALRGVPRILARGTALDCGARAGQKRVTPAQAEAGLIEFVLPEGENVLVDLGDDARLNPDVESDVTQVLLGAAGDHSQIYEALRSYAGASGLRVRLFLGDGATIVALGEPRDGSSGQGHGPGRRQTNTNDAVRYRP
jgi:hypothetical protein